MRKMLALLTTTHLTAFASGDTGTEITLPLGRIVWGHPLKPRHATDNQNNKKFTDDGKPVMEVSFGLAIPADQFAQVVWPAMAQEIAKGYSQGIPGNFSYKMTQPHEIDKNGKPYADREGYAGCVVLACSTTLQPPGGYVFENGAYRQIGDDAIKTGDYVQVGVNFKVNVPTNRSHTPSIYVNPLTVLLCYEGDAIAGAYTADPTQSFGAAPQIAPPPPGARQIGVSAPMQQPQGGMPGMQQPQGNMPPPATDFIPGAQAQQPQGMPGQGYQQAQQPTMGNAGGMPGMPQR